MSADETPEDVKVSLDAFAQLNPEATVDAQEDAFLVSKPWGDDSLMIRVSYEAKAVAETLNSLRLPPRFSAVWHMDTRDLEFVFGPLAVDDELRSRRFTFTFGGRSLVCEFADASERLVPLANAMRPAGPPSVTNLRNLDAIRDFQRIKKILESKA